jgi:hypothetical protein
MQADKVGGASNSNWRYNESIQILKEMKGKNFWKA